MSPRRELTLAAYARAVEQLLAGAAQGPVVLSPRDWQRVEGWYDLGIPLVVIHEALAAWAERGRAAAATVGPPTLSSAAPAVEEAWSVVLEGRLDRSQPAVAPPSSAAARRWSDRAAAGPSGAPLARLLEGLLARLAEGESAGELDDELDRALPLVADVREVTEIARELEDELAPFRWRIAPDRLEATRRRASTDRLRRRLGLPRLSESS